MKEYTYTPKVESVSGSLLIKVPTYIERLKLIKDQGLDKLNTDSVDMGSVIKMFEIAQKHVLKVEVEIDGEKLETLDELGMYQKGVEVINGVIGILAGGIPAKEKKD